MKKLLFLLVSILLITSCAPDNAVALKGTDKGKNLFIENPECGSDKKHCINSININGKKIADELNSTALEIDLKAMGLKEGDAVNIEIKCKKDCKVRILNSDAF
jgi:hypothetical protein